MEVVLSKSPYTFKMFDAISSISAIWDQIPATSRLLSSEYLDILERFPPDSMKFRYVLVYKSSKLVACLYFQIVPFKAADRLKMENAPKKSLVSCFYTQIKKLVAKQVDFVTLINGNLLSTGPYGFKLHPDLVNSEFQQIFDSLLQVLFKQHEHIDYANLCLLKELPPQQAFNTNAEDCFSNLHPFLIQPSMMLHLNAEWKSLNDYIAALQSKYRLRIKKALQAGASLTHKEFDLEQLADYHSAIYQLYLNTADGADFNLVKLNPNYFLELKRQLGTRYRIFGFFHDNELIAFYSLIDDGQQLLGHFLGTMKENNLRYQVYFNILIKFIEIAIQGNFKEINLARTAIEIKSSVGAVPVDLVCYLTHRNRIVNHLVPNLIQYLKPDEQFTIRKPFKKASDTPSS